MSGEQDGARDAAAFGPWVRRQRARLLLTQEGLAERAGVSVGTIQALESGRIGQPRPGTRRLLTEALTVPEDPAPAGAPRQLPLGADGFTGRRAELDRLDTVLLGPRAAAGPRIVIVTGMAGVGKTELVTYWAHRAAEHFPDGQLYVTMRGFDPTGAPMPPTDAVRMFLDGLGAPPQRRPVGLDAQVALFRSLVAGRRLLVVIDNVRDAEQVRPLVPGTDGCAVLVTSRDQLTGLAATHGAQIIGLDVPSAQEARELLVGRLGRSRVLAEPPAVDEIIERCARLPLALAVVAARAAFRADFPLATVASQLGAADARLEALSGDDAASDVRAVLSWSYHGLTALAHELFPLLGLVPVAEVSVPAAASLAGAPVAAIRPVLTELTRVHLLTESPPGRYSLHDLLRAFAGEQVMKVPVEQRHAAVHRLLDHYAQTSRSAIDLLSSGQPPPRPPLPPGPHGVTPAELAGAESALTWLRTEHEELLTALRYAAGHRYDEQTWRLALGVTPFLQRHGAWADQVSVMRSAVEAGARLDRPVDLITAYGYLGQAYTMLDRFDEARTALGHAYELARAAGDVAKVAQLYLSLAVVFDRQTRPAEALHHAEQAYRIHTDIGDARAIASALSAVGWYRARAGDHLGAVRDCRQALAAVEQIGDLPRQASTLHSLGYALHHLDRYEEAVDSYARAIELCTTVGEHFFAAQARTHLGDTYAAMGDGARAQENWRSALDVLEGLGGPNADEVRERLTALSSMD